MQRRYLFSRIIFFSLETLLLNFLPTRHLSLLLTSQLQSQDGTKVHSGETIEFIGLSYLPKEGKGVMCRGIGSLPLNRPPLESLYQQG